MNNELCIHGKIEEVARKIFLSKKSIHLIYAANSVGKTRLSMAYKDASKSDERHIGVYYNAYSEDLFYWQNDSQNEGDEVCLLVEYSSLNKFHSALSEEVLHEKLRLFNISYDFRFVINEENIELGIESVEFYGKNEDNTFDYSTKIKISRGEERIFIFCFFLSLFELDGFDDANTQHYFIDDPISSLDDSNLFITASLVFDLIKDKYKNKKIIITTHHVGFYYYLYSWIASSHNIRDHGKVCNFNIMNKKGHDVFLTIRNKSPVLSHMCLFKDIAKSIDSGSITQTHFVMLRQFLEFISSFLGAYNFSYVLEVLELPAKDLAQAINFLSHKNIFKYEFYEPSEDDKKVIIDIFNVLQQKFKFLTL